MSEVLKRTYSCEACGERYAQPQGVNRHYRAKHDPSSCIYCGAVWSRPYQYRDHIEKEHPGVDPDVVLGKTAGSRRRATAGRDQQPSAVRHDQRIRAVSLRPPPTLPVHAAAKATHIPSTFSSSGKTAQPVDQVVGHTSSRPSRPVAALSPPLLPPVGAYYGSLVCFDPIIEPPGVIHPYPFSVVNANDEDEVWAKLSTPSLGHTNIEALGLPY